MSSELEVGLIVAGSVALLSWGIWVTISVMSYNNKIQEATDIKKDFESVEKKLEESLERYEKRQKETEDRVTMSLDNFDKTLHMWKDTMIDELKSILRNDRTNRGGQRSSK
jgi:hypothetical protein